ncbi:MAG: carboxylesterase family protein [Phycisphaerales bacterium]
MRLTRIHGLLLISLATMCVLLGGCGSSVALHRQSVIEYQAPNGEQTHYLLYLPTGYAAAENAGRHYAMLVVLHGLFENGGDVEMLLKYGPSRRIEEGMNYSMIVVTPQNPAGLWNVTMVNAMVHDIIKAYRVDADRVYLTGVSVGGQATWEAAIAEPGLYAAIAPMATYGGVSGAGKIAGVKVWAFHGGSDWVATSDNDGDAVREHQAAGGESKLTIYNGVGHEVWEQVYQQSFLYEWLMKQKRGSEEERSDER